MSTKGLDGVAGKRVSDSAIVESYRRTGNVHKTAADVGLNHSSVHERLVRLGIERNINYWTTEDTDRLRREYVIFRNAGKLVDLARAMGREKTTLCAYARALGLTDPRHAKAWSGKWKYISEEAARALFETFRRQRAPVVTFCKKRGLDEGAFGRTLRKFFPDEWDAEIEAHAPRQTLYRFGRQFEYRVRDALREHGYFVLRSPQSRSPIDLVAIRQGAVLFVQCKRNGALGVVEWNTLLDLARSVGAIPLLAEVAAIRGHINYWRLLDHKDGTKKPQPRGAFVPENA